MNNSPEKSFNNLPPDSKEELYHLGKNGDETEETDAGRQELTKNFDNLVPLGELMLGSGGFRLNILSPEDHRFSAIGTLAFDHKTKEVLVNPDFIVREDLDEKKQTYVFCHEIGHFVQLKIDPDGYLDTFETARDKAREWPAEQQDAIKNAWRRYFNIFLDIDDNGRLEHYLPVFHNLDRADHPRKRLYQQMFHNTDYRQEPLHVQFLDSIIRQIMVPEEEVEVDESVREILEKPIRYAGRDYNSLLEFVKQNIFSPRVDFGDVLSRMRRMIEPIFEQLLKQDAEAGQLEPSPERRKIIIDGKEGEGMLDEETAKKIAEEIEKGKMTTLEKAAEAMNEEFNKEMSEAGFSEWEIKRMEEIKKRANDIYWDLRDLWSVFVHVTDKTELVMEEGFRSGKKISIDRLIKDLPTVLTDPQKAKIFQRRTAEQKEETIEPKKINLHLILDLSGSMDNNKREAVQETAYAVARSLVQFRRDMKIGSDESPLDIHLRITGFGTTLKELLELSELESEERTFNDNNPKELEIRLWRAIMAIGKNDLGGTEDSKALAQAFDWLGQEDVIKAHADGQETSVILEITDGETGTVSESKKLVSEMNKIDNVFTRGIRIPGSIYEDTPQPDRSDGGRMEELPKTVERSGSFEEVWGKRGEQLDDLNKLKKVMEKILYDALVNRSH